VTALIASPKFHSYVDNN